jgi:hypothetical protein
VLELGKKPKVNNLVADTAAKKRIDFHKMEIGDIEKETMPFMVRAIIELTEIEKMGFPSAHGFNSIEEALDFSTFGGCPLSWFRLMQKVVFNHLDQIKSGEGLGELAKKYYPEEKRMVWCDMILDNE